MTSQPALQPIFGYLRISEDPYGLRAGVTRQRDDVVATVARKGWAEHPIRWFEDNDLSAYKSNVHRPMFQQMLSELGEAHAMVAYNLDRLLRQPRELENVIDRAQEVDLTRVITAEGDIDLTTHDGQLHARILVAVAKKASDDTSRRVKRANRDRAERGLWNGRNPPFGYRRKGESLVIHEPEAVVLRQAVQDLLSGVALYQVADRLNITPTGLRRLLRSPTIIGQTSMWVQGWEPIIDPAQFADVRALLDDRRRRTPRSTDHWLSGVLACANPPCQLRPMVFAGGAAKNYACLECGNSAMASACERIVSKALWNAAFKFKRTAEPAPHEVQGSASDVTTSDEGAVSRLEQLAHDYASGLITRSEWRAAREVLIPLPPSPSPRRQPDPPPKNLRAIWPELSGLDRRRQAQRLLQRVEVSRHRGRRGVFDPSRLTPKWHK